MIDAPQLMELLLLWFPRDEPRNFDAHSKDAVRSQHTLSHVRLLDVYSHTDPPAGHCRDWLSEQNCHRYVLESLKTEYTYLLQERAEFEAVNKV